MADTALRWSPPDDLDDRITDFELEVPEASVNDLLDRVRRARLPRRWDEETWEQGTSVDYLRRLRAHWLDEFDWRDTEAQINELSQVMTLISGQPVHTIHARSRDTEAPPLLLLHGWPSSFLEFLKVVTPLSDPDAHGGDPAGSCHVVVPSLPGFGLSGPLRGPGWSSDAMADAMALLMLRLGYERFTVHGSDWGAVIATRIAERFPERLDGLHVAMALCAPPGKDSLVAQITPDDLAGLTEAELAGLDGMRWFHEWDGGYANIQSTRPHTLGPALIDSPVGLASWYAEKYRAWSDCGGDIDRAFTLDDVLAQVSLAWLTDTAESATMLYHAEKVAGLMGTKPAQRIKTPTGVTQYPREKTRMPRAWVEDSYNVVQWSPKEHGGHFAAHELPHVWLAEIREFLQRIHSHTTVAR